MEKRLQLQTLLEELLGSEYVYFQPPSKHKMNYPCIVYSRADLDTRYANDVPYSTKTRYKLTIIDANPDSNIPGKIATLPMSSFVTHYTADNLYHDIFNIYY